MRPSGGKVLPYWDKQITVTLSVGIWVNLGQYVRHCHDELHISCMDEDMCRSLYSIGSAVNAAFFDMQFDEDQAKTRTKK